MIKRLLAYHSIENIGIIVMGLGLALIGRSLGRTDWIILGMCGCLLHVWNHALFKALLFLSAGSVIHATHTREIDHLGGLARAMPQTALCFLVGAVAICGLPPLNGFVSEVFVSGPFDTLERAVLAGAVSPPPGWPHRGTALAEGVRGGLSGTARSGAEAQNRPRDMGPMACWWRCLQSDWPPTDRPGPGTGIAAGAGHPRPRPAAGGTARSTDFDYGRGVVAGLSLAWWLLSARLQNSVGVWPTGCGYPPPTRMQYLVVFADAGALSAGSRPGPMPVTCLLSVKTDYRQSPCGAR
jgi:hypothetical protein